MKNYMTPQELDAENRAILRENAAADRAEWAHARFDALVTTAYNDGRAMPTLSAASWHDAVTEVSDYGYVGTWPDEMPACESRVLTAKLERLLALRPVSA